MNATRNVVTAALMTVVTTVLLGVIYPLVITGIVRRPRGSRRRGDARSAISGAK